MNLLERHGSGIDKMEKTLQENCGRPSIKLRKDQKEGIALLLENFSRETRKQKASKAMMEGRLLEDTGLSNVGPYTKFGINLITAVMAGVVAEQLVSVQPMAHRTGEVRYLRYKYTNTKSGATAGDVISSALEFNGGNFEYSSDDVVGETLDTGANPSGTLTWLPARPGTLEFTTAAGVVISDDGQGALAGTGFTGTINYTTGAYAVTGDVGASLTGAYGYITTNTNPQVPEVETELAIMPMIAKSRKLKTIYSFDAAFDLQGDYGFDIDEESVAYFSAEIAHEIDGEIMNDLRIMAMSNAESIPTWDPTAPSGVSQMDHDDSFWNNIVVGGNIIFSRVKRGRYSFVIAGVEVCNTIETMRKFKPSMDTAATGPHIVGTINNVIVIKNPYYLPKEYIVGYKGVSKFDTGFVYAPYMPVTVIETIRDNGFDKVKGFMTAYGKASINPKLYVRGLVS